MMRIRQQFHGPRVENVVARVQAVLTAAGLEGRVRPGERVAITAGSRGIANIDVILKAVVDFVKAMAAQPFIVPAMGSHGGANVDGQLEILKSYGITEEFCGCPIEATMETVLVCQSPEGVDVYFDRHAYEADHVIVCGRVKPHTSFYGDVQSGLMKMLLIGLGKHRGASLYHRAFREFSFDQIVRSVASTVIRECRILTGVAILENGYEQTALIEAVAPHDFAVREPELLRKAYDWMATLPFKTADLLIVDEMGKNLSGTGMDTNVVGRKQDVNAAAVDEWPKINKIFVRSLTPQTHGNATGIGLADLTTKQIIDSMDYAATRVNCVTSGRTQAGMLPLYFETEQEAMDAALGMIGLRAAEEAKVLHVRSTLELEYVRCSEAYFDEVRQRDDLQADGRPEAMVFSEGGELLGDFA